MAIIFIYYKVGTHLQQIKCSISCGDSCLYMSILINILYCKFYARFFQSAINLDSKFLGIDTTILPNILVLTCRFVTEENTSLIFSWKFLLCPLRRTLSIHGLRSLQGAFRSLIIQDIELGPLYKLLE